MAWRRLMSLRSKLPATSMASSLLEDINGWPPWRVKCFGGVRAWLMLGSELEKIVDCRKMIQLIEKEMRMRGRGKPDRMVMGLRMTWLAWCKKGCSSRERAEEPRGERRRKGGGTTKGRRDLRPGLLQEHLHQGPPLQRSGPFDRFQRSARPWQELVLPPRRLRLNQLHHQLCLKGERRARLSHPTRWGP